MPWRLLKAQYIAESNLNPNAASPAGAVGIAQFMPATALEIGQQMGLGVVDRRMAGPSIEMGAYYMASLMRVWKAPRHNDDRIKLAQASYNAGPGNMIKSQARCGNPPDFERIIACLHLVTGHHAKETRAYVPRIWKIWARLEADR